MLRPKLFDSVEELAVYHFLVFYELTFLTVLLDLVYVGVVILLDLVFQQEGGLQAIVPQDEEVELELEDITIGVLQVDGPLIVLALVVLFDASAYDASLRLVQQILILVAYSSKF